MQDKNKLPTPSFTTCSLERIASTKRFLTEE